jgi:hypothetical protein
MFAHVGFSTLWHIFKSQKDYLLSFYLKIIPWKSVQGRRFNQIAGPGVVSRMMPWAHNSFCAQHAVGQISAVMWAKRSQSVKPAAYVTNQYLVFSDIEGLHFSFANVLCVRYGNSLGAHLVLPSCVENPRQFFGATSFSPGFVINLVTQSVPEKACSLSVFELLALSFLSAQSPQIDVSA